MKAYEHVAVLQVSTDRNTFTKHGQHMNLKGKVLMVRRIVDAIKLMLKVCAKESISLKRKTVQSINNQDSGKITNRADEEMKDSTSNQENGAQEPEESANGPIVGKDPTEYLKVSTYGPGDSTDGVGEGREETTVGAVDGKNDPINNLDISTDESEESTNGPTAGKDPTEHLNDSTHGIGVPTVGVDEGREPTVSPMKSALGPGEAIISDDEESDFTNQQKNSTQAEDINNDKGCDNQLGLVSQTKGKNCIETSRRTSSRNKKPPASRTGDFLWDMTS
jgi:hypothetical protein